MTWGHEGRTKEFRALEQAFETFGKQTGLPVIPVGLAWEAALKDKPDLRLYEPDKHHPIRLAIYLNACVLYAALTGHSPEGLGNGGVDELTPDMQAFLQRVAWETVCAYAKQAKDSPSQEQDKEQP